MTDEAPNSEEQTGRRGISSRMGRLTLLSVGPLGLAIAFGVYVAVNASTVTTENAYIKADKIAVSAEVSGHIAEVAVRENQLVEIAVSGSSNIVTQPASPTNALGRAPGPRG